MTTKIAITDDHVLVLNGIKAMLANTPEIDVVGTYDNGQQTLKKINLDKPDILLLDINLPDINGIELCKTLLKQYPELKILALTNFEEISFVKRMLSNGASGYLLKNTQKTELIEALKTVLEGRQYLQDKIEKKLMNYALGRQNSETFIPKLTRREKEVLEAISEELTTQEISKKLFVSIKTVETHRMNLMSKLGAKNSVGIIKKAIDCGLLD
ncbi:Two component transcriptional regulator, LuxR family protein [Croceitalea dokdonensis DOKDO 023]|uniref:Two component transcriptional regulator, LuxR family protein n=1 Tax=Croceitalea dokdonensis DOKDO 023 TaxID=1300341 RepID=A0A0P7ALK3_9FLAO|nr:response regulator transcription factor [Croceitalea dokdonensis]KPM32783.1 Two component transcriptional regulator, LuxR family protein [Croceitalea dokdonensis DOKDO 023]